MAQQHQRNRSTTAGGGGPHAISLKVLRLSRPTLTPQTPFLTHGLSAHRSNDHDPAATGRTPTRFAIPTTAALAYPSADPTSGFPLTPLLTLPAAFGAAYVGEVFACTLCANNELSPEEDEHAPRRVGGVQITAELQTPGRQEGIALEFDETTGGDGAAKEEEEGELMPGGTLQRTLRHELKDEGPHVLAVTVTYKETRVGGEVGPEEEAARMRTFRKLYQFTAQAIIAVRSKVTERKSTTADGKRQWVLEAQLENVGESSVVLEKITLREHEGIRGMGSNDTTSGLGTVLKPQDVEQVMFLLETVGDDHERSATAEGRQQLAQVSVSWRSQMGERGNLTTGWLMSRGR